MTVCFGLVGSAWAENVSYIDAEGKTQSVDATPLTGSETELPEGWYVVNSSITYDYYLKFSGSASIILADGCTMSVGTEDAPISTGDSSIYVSGTNNLDIYAASAGTNAGTLKAYHSVYAAIRTYGGNYTQYGGSVIAKSTYKTDTPAIYCGGVFTLNGGTLTATVTGEGSDAVSASSNININGGILNAACGPTTGGYYAWLHHSRLAARPMPESQRRAIISGQTVQYPLRTDRC